MTRSTDHLIDVRNPARLWFEWDGDRGGVRYYDADWKRDIYLGVDFQFILLDQLGSVRGWDAMSDSAVFSNEVRDPGQDVLLVKSFEGATLKEGVYPDISDSVTIFGALFVTNAYIAFERADGMAIGSLRFHGAALAAWKDFSEGNAAEVYRKAIAITTYTERREDRDGVVRVVRVPVMRVRDLSADAHERAMALDRELQKYLAAYLTRTRCEQADLLAKYRYDAHPTERGWPFDEERRSDVVWQQPDPSDLESMPAVAAPAVLTDDTEES